jgi:Tol biopolymer transport system component
MSRVPSLGVALVAAVTMIVACGDDPASPTRDGSPVTPPVAPPVTPASPTAPVGPVTPPGNEVALGSALLTGRVAFVSNQDGIAHIYVLKSDGTGATAITSGQVADGSPSWSADGARIAFRRDGMGIFVVNADGSGLVRLTSDPSDGDPDWSPDGTRIAFARATGREPHDIYVMGADGSAVTRLTNGGWNLRPAWSPDGRRIAFDHTTSADDVPWQIYTMARDGSDVRRLISSTDGMESAEGGARWSPDGRSIVYWSFVSGISVVASDGSGEARTLVRDFPEVNYWARPRWSPDGAQVLLSTNFGSASRHLVVLNADGTGRSQVKGMEGASAWDVTWVR